MSYLLVCALAFSLTAIRKVTLDTLSIFTSKNPKQKSGGIPERAAKATPMLKIEPDSIVVIVALLTNHFF